MGWKNVPGQIKAHISLVKSSEFFPAITETNDLMTVSLNVNFKNLQKLDKKEVMRFNKVNLFPQKRISLEPTLKLERKICLVK